MSAHELAIERFSVEVYAPFGTALVQPPCTADAREDFNAVWLLPTDVDGRPQHVYQRVFRQPLRVTTMERHHHVAQAFVPITRGPYIMVVAPPTRPGKDVQPNLGTARAFYCDGSLGLIINRGTWHALDRLPVDTDELDFFFITEFETQQDMARHAADQPQLLERSDIVALDREIALIDPHGLLPK
jgi:ureidoglycolate hydrolase